MKLLDKILPLIPDHKIYIELFLGSGAVFFNKSKAQKSILNDLDDNVISFLKLLKVAPLDESKYKHDLNTLPKIKYFYEHHSQSVPDKLLFKKIGFCNGFQGKKIHRPNMIYKDANPDSFVNKLEQYKDKLDGSILSCEDYEKVIKKYDDKEAFFFIDPPYEDSLTDIGYAEDKNTFDFERFANAVRSIKGKFLITINDSPEINKLFAGYHIKKVPVKSGWNNAKDKIRKELFITNY